MHVALVAGGVDTPEPEFVLFTLRETFSDELLEPPYLQRLPFHLFTTSGYDEALHVLNVVIDADNLLSLVEVVGDEIPDGTHPHFPDHQVVSARARIARFPRRKELSPIILEFGVVCNEDADTMVRDAMPLK